MIVRPEDRGKLVFLVIALLAVATFLVLYLRSALGTTSAQSVPPRPPAEQGPASAPLAPGASGQPLLAQRTEVPLGELDVTSPIPPGPGVDPFRSVVKVRSTGGAPGNAPTPTISSGGTSGGSRNPVADFGFTPFRPDSPPEAVVELKGVVVGPNRVAVLRVGEDDVIAREGEQLKKDLYLVTISSTGVVIQFKKRRIFLGIGATRELSG